MASFVSYADMTELMTSIGNKFRALNGAYVIKGNTTFAGLPATPTVAQNGYVYNITDDFTTDARFVEGAGKKFPAGTNVVIADIGSVDYQAVTPEGSENPAEEGWYEEDGGVYTVTADTEVQSGKTYYEAVRVANMKYDILGDFVDVDGITDEIDNVQTQIADGFNSSSDYAVGDIVYHNGKLYKFTSAHTAGDDWDSSEVSETSVEDLIDEAEPESLTPTQTATLIGLLD